MYRLQNMSVPPKSTITKTIEPVSQILILDKDVLSEKLSNYEGNLIIDKLKEYIKQNNDWDKNINKPESYMMALQVNNNNEILENSINCDNLNLMIYIMSKTYGLLYIPNKEPVFESDRFEKSLYFLKREVDNG